MVDLDIERGGVPLQISQIIARSSAAATARARSGHLTTLHYQPAPASLHRPLCSPRGDRDLGDGQGRKAGALDLYIRGTHRFFPAMSHRVIAAMAIRWAKINVLMFASASFGKLLVTAIGLSIPIGFSYGCYRLVKARPIPHPDDRRGRHRLRDRSPSLTLPSSRNYRQRRWFLVCCLMLMALIPESCR